jgi:hypothetical protein
MFRKVTGTAVIDDRETSNRLIPLHRTNDSILAHVFLFSLIASSYSYFLLLLLLHPSLQHPEHKYLQFMMFV